MRASDRRPAIRPREEKPGLARTSQLPPAVGRL